jgi:hypothetical protein
MRAGRDRTADLVDVFLHGFGVGIRHDQRDAGITASPNSLLTGKLTGNFSISGQILVGFRDCQ